MKPLFAIIFGVLLTLAVAADLTTREFFLNVVVATAWAQQDRGRDHNDRPRDERPGRGNEDRDRDEDRGRGNDDKDRDKHDDSGRANNDRDREQSDDSGRGNGDKDRDQNDDAGRGNNDKDREQSDDPERGNNDKDRDQIDKPGRGNDTDRDPDDAGRGNKHEDDAGRSDRRADNPRADNPRDDAAGKGGNGTGNNDNNRENLNTADRRAEPAKRGADGAIDNDLGELASKFNLDDTETFDDDGFLARRGEIIGLSADKALSRRAEALGLQVVEQEFLPSLSTTMYRLSVPAASPIDGILARLRAQDPDGVFDRNHLYDRSAAPASTHVGMPSRPLVSTANGVSVGLIDTGVDVLHPALHGTNVELRYFVDNSRVLPEAHGTAIVSLLVSPEFGALPGAQLYVACVFYEDRRGGSLSEARDLVRALNWLMERRVPVINMSLSGPPNEVLRTAIRRAIQAGHLIVAAVGNAGPASAPLYPAAYEGVIAVTAVDVDKHVYRRANRGAYVELAAVGVDVLAAAPGGLAPYSGTSFASPYVAALAAMEYRSLDVQKALAVKETLRNSALDLGKPGRDEVYGFGLARPRAVSTVVAR
jgi:subtilisin family serine protease